MKKLFFLLFIFFKSSVSFGHNYIQNGDFEEDGHLAKWIAGPIKARTEIFIDRDKNPSFRKSGQNNLSIVYGTTSQEIRDLKSGDYELKFWAHARSDESSASGLVALVDAKTNKPLVYQEIKNSKEYKHFRLKFFIPENRALKLVLIFPYLNKKRSNDPFIYEDLLMDQIELTYVETCHDFLTTDKIATTVETSGKKISFNLYAYYRDLMGNIQLKSKDSALELYGICTGSELIFTNSSENLLLNKKWILQRNGSLYEKK